MIQTSNPFALTTTRKTSDHVLSGSIATMIGAGAVEYYNYKNGKTSKDKALKSTLKLAAQGGIASGSAIAASNYLANKNYFAALSVASLGFGAIFAIEKFTKKED